MKKTIYFSLSVALLFTACKNTDYSPSAISAANDVVAANVDTTVSPADDFFQFVNGGWLKRNPIPASESNWGIGKVLQEDI